MKRILSAILLFPLFLNATNYYISTTGNDSNPGTQVSPFRNISKIGSLSLSGGDTVYILPGTYNSGAVSNSPQYHLLMSSKNGSSGNPIVISSYPAGARTVILNCADFSHTSDFVGIQIQSSSWLKFRGIRVTGIPQTTAGQVCIGWFLLNNGGNITLENCESDHIGNTGFRHHNTSDMTYLNCDAHHIDNPFDPGIQRHGGSDGFGCYDAANTSVRTKYITCRAWFCSDDGWDCNNSPTDILYDGCWSFWNGYVQDVFPLTHTQAGVNWGDGDGFKVGGDATPADNVNTKRTLRRCFAFENYASGIDQNLAPVKMEFYNNTLYNNVKAGIFVYSGAPSPMIARNNIWYSTVGGFSQNFLPGSTTQSNNSWNTGFAPISGDFTSFTNTGVDGARGGDGSLPTLSFMTLASTKYKDAGMIVSGVLYSDAAPDLGAFETTGSTPGNLPPIIDVGPDLSITLPASSVTLSSSILFSDTTIVSYNWQRTSFVPTGSVITPSETIVSPTSSTTSVTGLDAGNYVFRLTVVDSNNLTNYDYITVSVIDPGSPMPSAVSNIKIGGIKQ